MNELKTYIPKLDDLWFREKFMNDEETMSYNHKWGGVIPFPKDKWDDWYSYWIIKCGNERFYRYLVDDHDKFVGEIAYHFDDKLNLLLADIIIYSRYRKRGYGRKGLGILLHYAKENGFKEIYDNIAIGNPAIPLFIALGFVEAYRTEDFIMLKKEL